MESTFRLFPSSACVGWRPPAQANHSFCCLCPCKSAYALCRKRVRAHECKRVFLNLCLLLLLKCLRIRILLSVSDSVIQQGVAFAFLKKPFKSFMVTKTTGMRLLIFWGNSPCHLVKIIKRILSNCICRWKKVCAKVLTISCQCQMFVDCISTVSETICLPVRTTLCNVFYGISFKDCRFRWWRWGGTFRRCRDLLLQFGEQVSRM